MKKFGKPDALGGSPTRRPPTGALGVAKTTWAWAWSSDDDSSEEDGASRKERASQKERKDVEKSASEEGANGDHKDSHAASAQNPQALFSGGEEEAEQQGGPAAETTIVEADHFEYTPDGGDAAMLEAVKKKEAVRVAEQELKDLAKDFLQKEAALSSCAFAVRYSVLTYGMLLPGRACEGTRLLQAASARG